MKIIFFDKVLFEGTKEECEAFKKNFLDTLAKLDDELQDTYPMKETDTYESYFEALKILNPFVYEKLSFYKEWIGDCFMKYTFYKMRLASVGIRIYTNPERTKTKIYTLGFVFNIILFELDVPAVWRMEE